MGRGGNALGIGAIALLLAAGTAVAANAIQDGRIGPDRNLLANGRKLDPAGRMVKLGNFPTGGALTPDGRYYWTLSTGRGVNDIRIVSVEDAKVIQKILMPGLSGGIAMDPGRRRVYVSGLSESGHGDEQVPDDVPGQDGDVIHIFKYDKDGKAERDGTIDVPPPTTALPPQNFPPTDLDKISWPDHLAVSPDGKRLLVPLNLADAAAIVDVDSQDVEYVQTGTYPYGAAILPDGKTGLVSNEAPGTVSVIDLDNGSKVKDIQVGPHLSHPEEIAVDPNADRAYVALANSDQVVVIDTQDLDVERTLSTARPEGDGTSPVSVSTTRDGKYLLVAEAAADEIAVFRLPKSRQTSASTQESQADAILNHEVQAAAAKHSHKDKGAKDDGEQTTTPGEQTTTPGEQTTTPEEQTTTPEPEDGGSGPKVTRKSDDWDLVGRVPVASYAADAEATPERFDCGDGGTCAKLVWLSGKALGVGPNPKGPDPYVINDDNALSQNYLPSIVDGVAGILNLPNERRLKHFTPKADRQIVPTNAQKAPDDTPLRPDGPIKHVFYIVKENRTYDQVLGDDKRGDGDPKLAIFGSKTPDGQNVTPNAHALVKRFPLLDHVYANSEASIDGHFWTSAAQVSDYVHKNWNQNYAARNRPYDFGVYAVSWPQKRFLFDQLEKQGISYFNFGEAVAGVVPNIFPDKDRTAQEEAEVDAKFAKSDLGVPYPALCYVNDAFIFKNEIDQNPAVDPSPPPGSPPNAESRFDCFKQRFTLQLNTHTVPTFTYIVLPQDHTEGATPNRFTPRAYVARNDYALGQFVDLISHSSIWPSSAIFVIEDDSQDGADHIDAHRIPAFVISPYASRGKVVHTRYDFLSVIRSIELIIGMEPLGLFDQLATPMYDAFTPNPDENIEPFDLLDYTYDHSETNPVTEANRRMTHGLNLNIPDHIAQRDLDRQIWKTIYGPDAEPPPPGPNNVPGG